MTTAAVNDLIAASRTLRDTHPTLSVLERSSVLDAALLNGLTALAAHFGRELAPAQISETGYVDFTTTHKEGYGFELASLLNRIPFRVDDEYVWGGLQASARTGRIYRKDARRLIIAAAQMFAPTSQSQPQAVAG